MPQDSPPAGRWLLSVLAVGWLASCAAGLWVVWAWDNKPGESARAPGRWPVETGLTRDPGRPTLVMLVHPQCTCSRASLGELAELLARARPRPQTFILFLKPAGFSETEFLAPTPEGATDGRPEPGGPGVSTDESQNPAPARDDAPGEE